jgi:hypothetical protein
MGLDRSHPVRLALEERTPGARPVRLREEWAGITADSGIQRMHRVIDEMTDALRERLATIERRRAHAEMGPSARSAR